MSLGSKTKRELLEYIGNITIEFISDIDNLRTELDDLIIKLETQEKIIKELKRRLKND